MDNNTAAKWLDDLALYFERRDTHGEDKAFWANVYNAESVRKIKAALSAAEARIRELEGASEAISAAPTYATTADALCVLSSAKERLRELGWREGQYCPKGGEEFAVIEWGCSGIFPAVYHGEWPNGSLLYCDSFNHPHGCMFKPIANLTDAERQKMNECIDRDRVMSDREARAFGATF